MSRPIRCRKIERLPVYRSFSPDDITAAESVQMTVVFLMMKDSLRKHVLPE